MDDSGTAASEGAPTSKINELPNQHLDVLIVSEGDQTALKVPERSESDNASIENNTIQSAFVQDDAATQLLVPTLSLYAKISSLHTEREC